MEINDFLTPINLADFSTEKFLSVDSFFSGVKTFVSNNSFPDLQDTRVALIGVDESRGANPSYFAKGAADSIRKKLYSLKKHSSRINFVDIGNQLPGHKVNDTSIALTTILTELYRQNIIPIIIGGSQDLTFAHYQAFKQLDQIINIVGIDSKFDLGVPSDALSSSTYLGKIILDQPNYLFNYSQLAYQTYLVGQTSIDMMINLFFDVYRLGIVSSEIKECEPIIRNADIISFDISSIRQSDAPASSDPSPNGLYGEQACQLMQYAGMSDKMCGLGLYEYNPENDSSGQTASLIAQMIWYFVEGILNRKKDLPEANPNSFTIYRSTINEGKQTLNFLKSNKTGRWWMELPLQETKKKLTRHHFIPCSHADYITACNNEIPERWWQALQKIS